jgi:3-isopropylmalate dehydrogenase
MDRCRIGDRYGETGDLPVGNTAGTKKVGTQEMGDAIVKELDRLA